MTLKCVLAVAGEFSSQYAQYVKLRSALKESLPFRVKLSNIQILKFCFKFYNGLRVLCSNLGCNQYTSYSILTQHEIFQCLQRDISCPAESCPYVGNPRSIISHTIICPHQIYCQSCESKWPVTVYGHNCIKALQSNFLIEKVHINIVKHLSHHSIEEHDKIELPSHKIYTRPDENVLLTTLNVVRINRGKLLFGRRIDISRVEPEHLPAQPNNHRH